MTCHASLSARFDSGRPRRVTHETDHRDGCRRPPHAVEPPTLFNPFKDPRLKARPCDRLRMRTKPVIGPSSPSFSILKFANASSPVEQSAFDRPVDFLLQVSYRKHSEHKDLHLGTGSRPSLTLLVSDMSC